MDEILANAKKLRKHIEETEEFRRYVLEKELLESSDEIKQLRKLIVRAQNENRQEDYAKLLKEYHAHPLVINFENSKESLMELFNTIKSIIQ